MSDNDNSNASTASQTEQESKRRSSSLCKVLPTDRIAFDRQVEILRAYAVCFASNGGKPVSNAQAGGALNPPFSASTLGVAVPFFTDIGLISRAGSDFIPSATLQAYNQAVSLSAPEAKRKLRPLFENTWFYRVLAPRLQLSPQPLSECIGVLGIEAKAEKEHLPRVAPLIDFLDLAGIVSVAGSTVTFVPVGSEANLSEPKNQPPFKPGIFSEQEEHSLFLDKDKTRKFTINSPLFITQAEYDRVCKWIKVALIVEEDKPS